MVDSRQYSPVQWHKRRHASLLTERSSFEPHWRDVADMLLPRRGRRLYKGQQGDGGKINQKIIDSTGTHSLNILMSGLMSGVTSPARKWFALATPDREMMEFGPVRDWLTIVEQLMYQVLKAGGLYRMLPNVYEDLGAFGTSCLFHAQDFNTVARFGTFGIGEYCIAQNSRYLVDTVYRELPMTVEQVVHKFGDRNAPPSTRWQNISASTKALYDAGNYDAWVDTVHCYFPNTGAVSGSTKSNELPFSSFVYEGGEHHEAGKLPLETKGFRRFPVYVPRWHLLTPDAYGRSPGMDALGDIQQLQDQHKKKGLALAKMVNPPMVADAGMKNTRLSTLPGDVTFAGSTATGEGFRPAYTVQPRLSEFNADIDATQARIRRTMFSDLFLMITERPGVQPLNDSEVFERKEEKLLALGPAMQRLDEDLLGTLINNTFDDIAEAGMLPPPPEELAGIELEVEYLSIIAMAQRAQGLLGMQDTAAFVGQMAGIQQAAGIPVTVVDKFDFEQAVDEYADKRGVPAGIIRADDEVERIQATRAQEAQAQQAAEMAANAGNVASQLGGIESAKGNIAADLFDGAGEGPGVDGLLQ